VPTSGSGSRDVAGDHDVWLNAGKAALEVTVTSVVKVRKSHSGEKVVNNYVLVKELGKGAFGEVFLCRHKVTNEEYAMKVVRRSGSAASISHEISIMQQLDHEHIVALVEVIDDPTHKKIYLIQELMEGGPLMPDNETVTPIEEALARKYFRDILHGLCYLHAGGNGPQPPCLSLLKFSFRMRYCPHALTSIQ